MGHYTPGRVTGQSWGRFKHRTGAILRTPCMDGQDIQDLLGFPHSWIPARAGIDLRVPARTQALPWFPRPTGRKPYKRTFSPVHLRAPREQPQAPRQEPEAPNPKAATETHRPQTSKEGRSQSPTTETPSRANPGRGRSQASETSGLLPAEKPNPRAQGASSALCPGKTA